MWYRRLKFTAAGADDKSPYEFGCSITPGLRVVLLTLAGGAALTW